MKWFDKLFRRPPKNYTFAQTMNGLIPVYSQFGTDIYLSDVVQQAVKCIVDEIKKLNPTHVRYIGNDPTPIKRSTVQDVLSDPNPLMTTSEFLEKVTWLLMLNYNAFIVPVYKVWTDNGEERRDYEGLYPINPTEVDFIEDAAGRLFVKFWFASGYNTTFPYENVIHLKYNYSINQYMGGDELGQPNNEALLKTLELNKQLLDGLAKAMRASYNVNGIMKYNTLMDDAKVQEAIREFEQKLSRNESGILPLDLKTEYTPLEHKVELVDADTLKFIDEKILRNFGVPLAILMGDFTKEQYEAFYQKTLEPIVVSMSQAFTKKMFTSREKAFGNRIELYPKELIFMTISQTLEMINILSPTGGLSRTKREQRSDFGRFLNWKAKDICRSIG